MSQHHRSLAELAEDYMETQRISRIEFATFAKISRQAAYDATTGKLEQLALDIAKNGSNRKKNGISRTICRLVVACDENPKVWVERLGLPFRPDFDRRYPKVSRPVQRILDFELGLKELEFLIAIQRTLDQPLTVRSAIAYINTRREQNPTPSA